jgi:hypothetical protein
MCAANNLDIIMCNTTLLPMCATNNLHNIKSRATYRGAFTAKTVISLRQTNVVDGLSEGDETMISP